MPFGSLILPFVLWDNRPPNCQISTMMISETEKSIYTGTTSGHIIIWEFSVNEITPVSLMIGHTAIVNCLARAGCTRDEEFIVSSSENGEMKLWEVKEQKCIENVRMANTVHKHIYSSKLKSKVNRLFCIGNYTDVLVMDPMSLDILYTLVSREQHQWINALCINTLANKQDEVIVGVSVTGTIKLWTVSANETKGSEIIEHEFKNCLCENAYTLTSCPGKQRIFIVVCPKFFQVFDAFDFTVLCQVRINSIPIDDQNESVVFTNGFFIDINNILVCASNGHAYLYLLPDNVNPQSANFRKQAGQSDSEKFVTTRLVCKFTLGSTQKGEAKNYLGTPVFNLYEKHKVVGEGKDQKVEAVKYLICGDWSGRISVWNLSNITTSVKESDYEMSLCRFWKENVKPESTENFGFITTFLYLPAIDRLVYGTNDGYIIILPAIDFLIKNLFKRNYGESSNYIRLRKHSAKITCILYPHSENQRYDMSYLVTGSADSSVILWNINTGEMIHRFIVQAGEILQLSVPPNNVNPRILQCVCSIAGDHSVALLSLKECKPVMVASNHLFPILFVKWRPLDDYLLVKCSDGGLFVWQIETGSLDRVAHGLLAEDILASTDEIVGTTQPSNSNEAAAMLSQTVSQPMSTQNNTANSLSNSNSTMFSTPMIMSSKSISNQTIALAHILQKRNFATSIKLVNQKIAPAQRDSLKRNHSVVDSSAINYPLVMQTFHLSSKDPVNHLLLFDVDALLTTLILEDQSIDSMANYIKVNYLKESHNSQHASTQLIPPLYRTTTDHTQSSIKRIASAKTFDCIDIKQLNELKSKLNYAQSILKLTNILLSSLHLWTIDQDLDSVFSEKLCIQKPKYPITFGRISRGSHVFVRFPSKKTRFDFKPESLITHTISNKISGNLKSSEENIPETPSPTSECWISGKFLTTEHLLAILAISNSFLSLTNFINLQLKNENVDYDPLEYIIGESSLQTNSSSVVSVNEQIRSIDAQSALKQTYSRLSTMYCMISDYHSQDNNMSHPKTINLETLALKWMDPSYEIREAAQALVKTELKRIGPAGRSALVKTWEIHLSSLLKEFDDLSQLNVQQSTLIQGQPLPLEIEEDFLIRISDEKTHIGRMVKSSTMKYLTMIKSTSENFISEISSSSSDVSSLDQDQEQSCQIETKDNNIRLNRIRRKQYVAIIVLSLIGAEFGQDINTNKSQASKNIPQGFSLEDHSILKRISTALSNLVTNKNLGYDITRRAALDLIGRGFTVWEPFIQPTFVLLTLLELSADAELYVPNIWKSTSHDNRLMINLPLTPIADTCRISRNSITMIANSKPKTFILAIAKEIKRITASSGQSAQSTPTNYAYSAALTRGKPEILKIIEKLIDNQSQDVFELLSDVIEIVLFCIDMNQVKNNSLEEIFPAIFRFPMVRYCRETKHILCGCHNGRLVMYEFKTNKWHFQSYPAHNSQPIVAVAIAADFKYMASYSAHDNSLIFWQSSGGSLFSLGSKSNTLKILKVCSAAPIKLSVPCNKLAHLSWQGRTLNLVFHDGRRFSYQI